MSGRSTAFVKACLSEDLCGAEVSVKVSVDDNRTLRAACCPECEHVSRWSSTFHPMLGGWQLEPLLEEEDPC